MCGGEGYTPRGVARGQLSRWAEDQGAKLQGSTPVGEERVGRTH